MYVQTTRYIVSIYFQQTNDRVLLPFNKRMLYKFDVPHFFFSRCLLLHGALSHLFRTGFDLNSKIKKLQSLAQIWALTLVIMRSLARLLAHLPAHSLVCSFVRLLSPSLTLYSATTSYWFRCFDNTTY